MCFHLWSLSFFEVNLQTVLSEGVGEITITLKNKIDFVLLIQNGLIKCFNVLSVYVRAIWLLILSFKHFTVIIYLTNLHLLLYNLR